MAKKRKETVKPVSRPFASWDEKDIEKRARRAAAERDIETFSYCIAELSPKHRHTPLTTWLEILESAQTSGISPVEWLEKAAETTGLFKPETNGRHHLYIVLLSGLHGKTPGYGLYVGETSKPPEIRFQEHLEGKRNRKGPLYSRVVYRHCECLLPSLYNHLNPLSRAEAKILEGKIAEALKLEGIPVYGGH
jgi:hypothetical protein